MPAFEHLLKSKLFKWFLAMKLIILLLTIASLHAYSRGYSQETVSLSIKNMDLRRLFTIIQRETQYKFLYKDEVLPGDVRVSLNVSELPVTQVLDLALAHTDLTYKVLDNDLVVITTRGAEVNDRTVHGKVTDETGTPLPGVSVKVKGMTAGTMTDAAGDFSIRVPDDAILVISAVGYAPQEIPAKGSVASIHLVKQASSLDQVVVVGYGTQKKVDLTGAVASIGGEVLENRPIPNIGRGLQGELTGLNITTASGQPGQTNSFNIRGFTSINGGSPYILVDGVPTDIDDLNPNDVASVTVLKDAASAAVYGSRAPFGVILITTKSGKKGNGSPVISYSNNFDYQTITHLPPIVVDPNTVVTLKNESYSGYYGVNLYNAAQVAYAQQRSQNPSLPATIVSAATASNPIADQQYDYFGSTNWFKVLYNPSNPSQTHNINVSGATDKISYYLSGGYNQQTGEFRYSPDVYDRYNLRIKLAITATKWLTISDNTAYNRTQYNAPSLWTSDWTSGDLFHQIGRANSLGVLKNPDGSWTSAGTYVGFVAQGGRNNTNTNEIQNTLGFATNFFGNTFRVKGDFTFRAADVSDGGYQVALPYETGPAQTIYTAGHSTATYATSDVGYQVLNLYSEYEKTFGKHYFKALVGFNQELYNFDSSYAENNNLISNNVGYLGQTTGTTPSVGGGAYQWAIRGAFYRVNYSYKNRYLLELDGRYDGSSRFPVNSHYGFFPSASAGWRISEEPFFTPLKHAVNNLKLRASYGTLGNDQSLGNYSFIPILGSGQVGSVLGGVQPVAVYNPNLVSSSLTWEQIYTKDVGVDINVLRKLDGTFDWYQRDTKKMITYGAALPSVLGASQPLENAADLRTSGWELSLSYKDEFRLAGKPFTFAIRGNVWDNQTVITSYYNPSGFWFGSNFGGLYPGAYTGDYYKGMHIGDIWGFKTVGIFQTNAEGANWADQSKLAGYYPQNVAGEIKYADLNHDGKIDYGNGTLSNPGDARVIGNSSPRYSFGGGGNFSWNGFDLSFFLQGVGKRDFWPGTSGYYWGMFFAPWENVLKSNIGTTWTPNNPNAFYPSMKGWRAGDDGSWVDLAVPQTRYVLHAAYLRLKNVTLGYTLPSKLLHRYGIEQLRFYVSGEDLWERTKLPDSFDPEGLGGSWGTGKVYPFQRAFSYGLSLRF